MIKPLTTGCIKSRSAGLLTILIAITLIFATSSLAANFLLAWDSNCNDNPTLIGYNIYYAAGSSVVADPDNANFAYVSLDDPDFNPDYPSYDVTGLQYDVKYYFAVTAVYEEGESGMSNEASGIRTSDIATSYTDTTPVADTTPTTDTPATDPPPVTDTTSTPITNTSPATDTTQATDTNPVAVPPYDANTDMPTATDATPFTMSPPATDSAPSNPSPAASDANINSSLTSENSNAPAGGSSGGGCFIATLN